MVEGTPVDPATGKPVNAGKLVLSPTRTYAPVVRKVLEEFRGRINAMVHCSGGAQTKVMNFADHVRVVKDNMFDLPPLFRLIQEQSGTDWREMYQVFNMGHRFEFYLDENIANRVIEISESFGVAARIIGRVEASDSKELIIQSPAGRFVY